MNKSKRAIIAGIAGQDGSYLAELLLGKGYKVLGFIKKDDDTAVLSHLIKDIMLEETELVLKEDIVRWTRLFSPDEIYNFAAVSFIPDSWDDPYRAFQVNALLVAAFLDVVRSHCPGTRFYQASSSEIFGDPPESPQTESTPKNPVTPYGVSKLAAHQLVGLYRKMHRVFAVSGILYNHESPRRPERYVTQKIARAAAEISRGRTDKLKLGNIDACRDWGFAGDFVRGIWMMLQAADPDDYIVATGELHSIRDFLDAAFRHVGLDWKEWVEVDPSLIRPVDVGVLVGDPSKAREKLGWVQEVAFEDLVRMMVNAHLERLDLASHETGIRPAT
ncbi:MAG: GDP-mannose 4,6-dehydratase [Deltaproteobacteria bacterium]|nr:MAG: GDP-mannose 4,6-dehydratase [Deltaproteobacteria bacterium]